MKFLTYRELGEELSLSIRYLQKCVQQGALPCIRFGKAVRFDPKAVAKWIYKQNQTIKEIPDITNNDRAIGHSQ
jgi:excisionase family DNA binding protein